MSTFGRLIGIVGLVALLSVPLTLFLWDWEFTWLAATKVLFGVFAVVFWFFSNAPSLRATFQGRSAFYLSFTILFIVLALGAAVIVNYVCYTHPLRFDLTKNKIYTLSDQSVQMLAKLDDTVKATAFYSSKEPLYETVREYLERYRYASNRFTYELLDPVVRQDLAEKYGIQIGGPRIIFAYKNTEERVKIDEGHNPEEAITIALLKITSNNSKPKICFSTGHGEKTLKSSNDDTNQPGSSREDQLNSLGLLVKDLGVEGYQTDTLLLPEKKEIPTDCGLVVLAGPRSNFSPDEITAIKKYLDGNGKLVAFIGAQDTRSLANLLKEYGVDIGNNVVVSPERRTPLEIVSDPASYAANHPILSRLAEGYAAIFPMTRSVLALTAPTGLEVTSLVSSSKHAWGEVDKLEGASTVEFTEGKDLAGPVSLAVAVERKDPAASSADKSSVDVGKNMRLAVFGSSHLVVDAYYLVYEFNRNLVMNSIAWLANEGHDITIRPNFRAATLLRLDESQMKFVTFFSIDILPLLILAFGIAIWQTRRWS